MPRCIIQMEKERWKTWGGERKRDIIWENQEPLTLQGVIGHTCTWYQAQADQGKGQGKHPHFCATGSFHKMAPIQMGLDPPQNLQGGATGWRTGKETALWISQETTDTKMNDVLPKSSSSGTFKVRLDKILKDVPRETAQHYQDWLTG